MGGLVRYRGDGTHPPNPGTQNSKAFNYQPDTTEKVGGFARYRGEPAHPLK